MPEPGNALYQTVRGRDAPERFSGLNIRFSVIFPLDRKGMRTYNEHRSS